jgi:dihydrofolate reductase
MKIALIAALDENNGIGKDNKLLCYLPADLKRFKQLTTGHCIVMGRKTFESLPNGPLPNRRNIVLTRNPSFKKDGVDVINSVDEVFDICKNEEKVFVIGGEEVYKLFMQKADILYITRTHHQFDADAYFPDFNEEEWKLVNKVENQPDEKNKFSYSFLDYEHSTKREDRRPN